MSLGASLRERALRVCIFFLMSAAALWVSWQAGIHFGRIQDVVEVGGGYDYVRLQAPFRAPVSLVVGGQLAQQRGLSVGRWALAHGDATQVEDRIVVRVDAIWVAPVAVPDLAEALPILPTLALGRTELIFLALVILVVGGWAVRLLAQIVLATVFAGVVWAGARTAIAHGLIAEPSAVGLGVIAFVCAIALVLVWGLATTRAGLVYRIASAALLWLAIPAISGEFAMPDLAAKALVALALSAPTLTPATLGAALMVEALEPQDLPTRAAIVAACTALTLLTHHGMTLRRRLSDALASKARGGSRLPALGAGP